VKPVLSVAQTEEVNYVGFTDAFHFNLFPTFKVECIAREKKKDTTLKNREKWQFSE